MIQLQLRMFVRNIIFCGILNKTMKEQTPDQNIQLLLKHFQIQHPKRKCLSGNDIAHVCVNSSCQSNALFCEQQTCNNCLKAHIICESVHLRSFTYLLQKRAEGQRQFIIKIFEIENLMIQEIQKRRKALIKNFYLGDLQVKYLKVIESLYVKKDQGFKLKSDLAEQTYEVLKRTNYNIVQSDRQLLQTFRTQVQNIIKTLSDTQGKLIEEYTKKSKTKANVSILEVSAIIPKENTNYLKFLSQSFPGVKRFKLLFRASEHGFQVAKFHQFCDNIRHTFTLIKTEFGKVIGGYTPLKWNEKQGNGHVADTYNLSFLLSFNLGQKMRLIQSSKAIFNSPDNGPSFGGGMDIYIHNKCNQANNGAFFPTSYNCNGIYKNNQNAYTAFVGSINGYTFKVPEYEVYQVIW